MLLAIVFAYLLGSLSTAVIICRLAGLPDPRTEGSKNPGTTNVLRLGGRKLAAATLLFDALKGFVPVAVVFAMTPNPWIISSVMVAVFLGHLYPLFFGFKGGKGVATALGIMLALSWKAALMVLATWGVIAWLFRFSSLAALTAALLAPLYLVIWSQTEYAFAMLILVIFVFWRHRSNIQRLLKGVEPKIGRKMTKE